MVAPVLVQLLIVPAFQRVACCRTARESAVPPPMNRLKEIPGEEHTCIYELLKTT